MSTNRTASIAISVMGTLLLACVLFTAWTIWKSRPRTVSLEAPPFALRDDATALNLAQTAMRKFDYDPAVFAPPLRGTQYDSVPDMQQFTFFSTPANGSADHPGVHVRLEQQGTTVVCSVMRRK